MRLHKVLGCAVLAIVIDAAWMSCSSDCPTQSYHPVGNPSTCCAIGDAYECCGECTDQPEFCCTCTCNDASFLLLDAPKIQACDACRGCEDRFGCLAACAASDCKELSDCVHACTPADCVGRGLGLCLADCRSKFPDQAALAADCDSVPCAKICPHT